MKLYQRTPRYLTLKERFIIFVIYAGLLYALYVVLNGSWIPSDGGKGLWFASAIGFVIFSLLDAPFFTKPNDTLASSAAGFLLLLSIDLSSVSQFATELNIFRWIAIGLTLLLFLASVLAIWTHNANGSDKPITRAAYAFSVQSGVPALIFTPPALIGIFGFYQSNPGQMLVLGFVWVVLVVMRPVELIWQIGRTILSAGDKKEIAQETGSIVRVDSPNIIRVTIDPLGTWEADSVHVACLSDSKQVYVLPLFTQVRDGDTIGTGLCMSLKTPAVPDASPGIVYSPATLAVERKELVKQLANHDGDVELIGFVVEGSRIAAIDFELSTQMPLKEGHLVFCQQEGAAIYYQVTDARTVEESFERNPRGTYVVTASQIGIYEPAKGFVKYPWLPKMNTPVFLSLDSIQPQGDGQPSAGLKLGELPGSNVAVHANYPDLLGFHTAILGVTGMGKTELAFDIIRHGLTEGVKVFCVDLTGDYAVRLDDCSPDMLGFDASQLTELEDLIFGIETGQYSAGDEKKALKNHIEKLKPDIEARINEFLSAPGGALGIFELPEIANTAATLRATELYISTLFNWARSNRGDCTIQLVLEEAHTIVPEFNLYERDRTNTRAIVGRLAQIALQGRKYGVGLLLISQRTALVSKTLLSQCNTCITFSLVDQTSLEYLANFYGRDHIRAIPGLAPRQALVFGKGILSERPVIMEIPFDPDKLARSKAVRKTSSTSQPVENDTFEVMPEEDDIPF